MVTKNFLLEIGTEELPPLNLKKLAECLMQGIIAGLEQSNFTHGEYKFFATPRRLAVLIKDLAAEQPEQIVERRGPALTASFDKNNSPTKAALGFAVSCNMPLDKIGVIENDKGSWLFCKYIKPGENVTTVISSIIRQSIKSLPVSRLMRWGCGETEFVRPVHWILMLYGNQVVDGEVLGVKAANFTYGHRFHYPQKITLDNPDEYESKLENPGFVIVDYARRKQMIAEQINKIANQYGHAVINDDLLNQVNSLVEFPVALLGNFNKDFLHLPHEVLITSMQKNQRCFAVKSDNDKLLPHFISISNIASKEPQEVITGNERVINARLTDAKFFWQTDTKKPLIDFLPKLKKVIFQEKLGTVYDKCQRVLILAKFVGEKVGANKNKIERAALLAKADLTSEMVYEFPELQGIMGYYYALNSGEERDVAEAVKEHYLPKFAIDNLPSSTIGYALAIADRIDSLVGIFGINMQPTGEKDPYGLRRSALGVLRIIIEKQLDLDIRELVDFAISNYKIKLQNKNLTTEVVNFVTERLRYWYLEQGVKPQTFAAVYSCNLTKPLDFDKRLQAVIKFQQLPEAEALAAANKRVGNILRKSGFTTEQLSDMTLDEQLLKELAEKHLAKLLGMYLTAINKFIVKHEYVEILAKLTELKSAIDGFFDDVMVMVEDDKLRNNRLVLLNRLRDMFLSVADISLL